MSAGAGTVPATLYGFDEMSRLSLVSRNRLIDWEYHGILPATLPGKPYRDGIGYHYGSYDFPDVVVGRILGAVLGSGRFHYPPFVVNDRVRAIARVRESVRDALTKRDLVDVYVLVPRDDYSKVRVATSRAELRECINGIDLVCAANLGIVCNAILDMRPRPAR